MFFFLSATTKTKRQRGYEDKISKWASGKAQLVSLQEAQFEAGAKLEMEQKKITMK